MRRLILLCGPALALTLSGCATAPVPAIPPAIRIEIPAALTAPCAGPRLPQGDSPTIGAVLAFTVDQEASLALCEAKRAQAVALIETANSAAAEARAPAEKRPWWRILPLMRR